ncbi:3-oxoacyl-reductase [Setomelanomma holmii]|uniref:3-oxoacyl-reductase n=1 Tax=Setomelanomma holmii TaxID=210430 RepID=A0A9P4H2K6_9PLEO|nr:3-oxoacyl-reductase [Setomelanomma holmii]
MTDKSHEAPLKGEVALITGATGGIGKATTQLLANLGCSVAVHFNSDKDGADALVQELGDTHAKKFGTKFLAFGADVGDYEQVRTLHSDVVKHIGPPTILVNNAGSTGGQSGVKSVGDVSINDFEKTWRVNCGSAYLLTQLCIPNMEKQGYGRVIFVSSVAGITGGIIGPHYASSKSALHGLIHWLANTYAKKGITVNGIAPALIEQTKMLPGSSEELSKTRPWCMMLTKASEVPIGRLGTPDEIADTILWMVKTGYVTNKIIAVDGGMFPQ